MIQYMDVLENTYFIEKLNGEHDNENNEMKNRVGKETNKRIKTSDNFVVSHCRQSQARQPLASC